MQTQHQYDEFGRLNGQSWAMGGKSYQETYTYNNQNGSLTGKQITLPTSETANISLGYDGLSRLASVTTPVSKTYYNYADAFYGGGTTRQVSQMSVNPVSTGSNVFTRLYFRYNYDALGNITKIEDFGVGSTIANSTQYTYDEQSQLEKAVSTRYGTWTYDYDTYGNIRRKTHGANTTNYTYNDADWLDLLTAVSGTKDGTSFSESYTYDGAGNPTSYFNVGDLSSWTMTWKNGRELATAGNGTHSISYDYDVSGLRTYKIVDGVRHDYTYASGLLLRETYTQNGTAYTLDFVYDQSNRPYILNLTTTTGSTTSTTAYYYLLNLQGDVVKLVNGSGVVVASYDYDAYGNILTSTGTLKDINPLRYRGYYYDSETGFYYLQSRYFDPQIGRFINADSYASTGQGFLGYNMFAYCLNRPINNSDSAGRRSVCAVGVSHKRLQPGSVKTGSLLNELNRYLSGGGAQFSLEPYERALDNDNGKGTYTVTKEPNTKFNREKENQILSKAFEWGGYVISSVGSIVSGPAKKLAISMAGKATTAFGEFLSEPSGDQVIPDGLICTKYEVSISYSYGNDIGQLGKNVIQFFIYELVDGEVVAYGKTRDYEILLFN